MLLFDHFISLKYQKVPICINLRVWPDGVLSPPPTTVHYYQPYLDWCRVAKTNSRYSLWDMIWFTTRGPMLDWSLRYEMLWISNQTTKFVSALVQLISRKEFKLPNFKTLRKLIQNWNFKKEFKTLHFKHFFDFPASVI